LKSYLHKRPWWRFIVGKLVTFYAHRWSISTDKGCGWRCCDEEINEHPRFDGILDFKRPNCKGKDQKTEDRM